MKREVQFSPAYDKRDKNPSKNYGIHGVELRMYLIGELGAVQFVLYTNWQLPEVTKEIRGKPYEAIGGDAHWMSPQVDRSVGAGGKHPLCLPWGLWDRYYSHGIILQ